MRCVNHQRVRIIARGEFLSSDRISSAHSLRALRTFSLAKKYPDGKFLTNDKTNSSKYFMPSIDTPSCSACSLIPRYSRRMHPCKQGSQ